MERPADLPTLLWASLSALDIAHSEQGAGMGGLPSLEIWSNAVRALDADGVERRRLPVSLRLSKRAVRANLVAAARRGWTEEVPAGHAGRGVVKVRLTTEGAEAAARWEPLRGAAEAVWGARARTLEGRPESEQLWRSIGRRAARTMTVTGVTIHQAPRRWS